MPANTASTGADTTPKDEHKKPEITQEDILQEEISAKEVLTDGYLVGMMWRFIAPYKMQLVGVFVLLLGVTGVSLFPPYLIQRAVDGPITTGNLSELWPFAIIYFSSIPVLFGLRFAQVYLLQTVGQNALFDLRNALFKHILKQDMKFFNKTPVGLIVSRMSNDIEALTELLSTSIVIVVTSLFMLLGIVGVMFALNWRLALISLSVLPVMAFMSFMFRSRIRKQSSRLHRIIGDYQAFLNEHINGMLIVQLFGRQEVSRDEFDDINDNYRDVHMRLRDVFTIYSSILQLLVTVGTALVLYGGGSGVLAGWATLGMLISFIQYTRRSFEPILGLSEQFGQIQSALSAGERIARMLQVEPEILPPENPVAITDPRRDIKLENLYFHYAPDAPVLRGIDLHIEPGQRVAIVGATGAGKTSLAGLLARFYDVIEGHVRIDGVDVRDLSTEDLRRAVMVVPQSPYCFNGTIADNLRLFDDTVSDERMFEAAKAARAHNFIQHLPGGYDYKLLPGGANLSQGQRQLLALARALIHNPDSILVLDEATSNIDTETEVLIQEALVNVLANRTSVIIAHRLSTVRDADRILVMKAGQIVEDGKHDDLLALEGVYAELYERQFEEVGLSEGTPSETEPRKRRRAS